MSGAWLTLDATVVALPGVVNAILEVKSPNANTGMLIALVAFILIFTGPAWAVITPYITESFRTEIRSSGYGLSYSLATIVPGFYSFYMLALAKLMPYELSPVVLLAAGGLLLTLGALAGPETKHVEFHAEVPA